MINFIPEDFKMSKLTPSIKFSNDDGYFDASLLLDDIEVAYFNIIDGGLVLLDFETGPYIGGDDSERIKYLTDRGVVLETRNGHAEGYYLHRIKVI